MSYSDGLLRFGLGKGLLLRIDFMFFSGIADVPDVQLAFTGLGVVNFTET